MTNNKDVAVGSISAVYNSGKWFSECLTGLLNQTRPIQYITVIDDGSTDNSREIIKEEVEKNFKIISNSEYGYVAENGVNQIEVILKLRNSGPAHTRNLGVKALLKKTNFIQIADSDDILYPTKVEKSLEVAIKFPVTALIFSDYNIVNTKTNILTREFKEIYSYKRLFEECIVSNNSFIATNIFEKVGLYDETLFGPEDYDLWMRISDIAAIYHIPEALYQYRVTGDNITTTIPSKRFAEHVARAKQKAVERRQNGH